MFCMMLIESLLAVIFELIGERELRNLCVLAMIVEMVVAMF